MSKASGRLGTAADVLDAAAAAEAAVVRPAGKRAAQASGTHDRRDNYPNEPATLIWERQKNQSCTAGQRCNRIAVRDDEASGGAPMSRPNQQLA